MIETYDRWLGWIVPIALLACFVFTAVDAITSRNATDAMLSGIAIGILVAALLIRCLRKLA